MVATIRRAKLATAEGGRNLSAPTDPQKRGGPDSAPETTSRSEIINSSKKRVRVKADAIAWNESHHAVPTVPPFIFFDEPDPADLERFMTPEERRRKGMMLAVVRSYLKIEERSFAEIGEEFGVTRAAVSYVNRTFLAKIGALDAHDRAICRVSRACRRKSA